MTVQEKYVLARDRKESERLNAQSALWRGALGWTLAPSLLPLVTKTAHIAELGTGTAVWLQELGHEVPPTTTLVGFDISAEQFPPSEQLQPNMHLEVLDATQKKVPPQSRDRFDIVHLRLLTAALHTRADWVAVAQMAYALVKPGGAVQWEEGDFVNIKLMKGRPDSTVEGLDEVCSTGTKLYTSETGYVGARDALADVLQEVGFANVSEQAVPHDGVPGHRADWDVIMAHAYFGIVRKGIANGSLPGWDTERFNAARQRHDEDLKSGAYLKWDILAFTGRKLESA